ncbi:MAG: ATP-grasp domain-containing protein [Nitrospinae bacterium]|nr:ATP-grasp domain-containing protein [Nitrospinota bacterium]
MKQKTLVILGGNIYSVPSIATLNEHGFRTVVVDGNPQAPGMRIAHACGEFDFRDVEKGIELAKRENAGAVIPTHDRAVLPAALISQSLGLRGPSPVAARTATSKKLMRQAWCAAGLPSPAIRLADSRDSFAHAVRETGFPAICKPTDDVGGGSRGVRKIEADADLNDVYAFASSFSDSPEVLVEPYFEGLEHSAEVLMRGGEGVTLMVSDKVKTPPPYRVDKSVLYPSRLNGAALENVKRLAIKAARAVGLVDGAAHVELCTLPDGSQMLFEIGLRCGGGATPHPIAELTSGVNEMVEYAEILLGNSKRSLVPNHSRGAVFHFITASPGKIKEVSGFEIAAALPGIIDAYCTAKPGDTVRGLKTSADRLGYFVSAGDTAEEAHRRALDAEGELLFEYEG